MKSLLWALAAALAANGCNQPHSPPAGETGATAPETAPSAHADEEKHETLPTRVRLDPAVIAAAAIQTAPAAREVLSATLELSGEVASDPDQTASVSPPVAGRIRSVHFKEGQLVKAGDVLAVLEVPELGRTAAALAATRAKALAARGNAQRLQALSQERLAPAQEAASAAAEAAGLEADTQALEGQLRAIGTDRMGTELALRAPRAGTVVTRSAIVGQPVSPDQSIASIANLRELWFLGRVFEQNLGEVQLGAATEVRLNAYPQQPFEGSIEYIGKQVDPTARTVMARIRLTNRDDLLRIGLFGVARVRSRQGTGQPAVLVVPRSAVTEIGHEPVVFVRQADGDFDLHEVVLGEEALGKVQIVSGLREGEQTVIAGVFTLKSKVLESTFGEED